MKFTFSQSSLVNWQEYHSSPLFWWTTLTLWILSWKPIGLLWDKLLPNTRKSKSSVSWAYIGLDHGRLLRGYSVAQWRQRAQPPPPLSECPAGRRIRIAFSWEKKEKGTRAGIYLPLTVSQPLHPAGCMEKSILQLRRLWQIASLSPPSQSWHSR